MASEAEDENRPTLEHLTAVSESAPFVHYDTISHEVFDTLNALEYDASNAFQPLVSFLPPPPWTRPNRPPTSMMLSQNRTPILAEEKMTDPLTAIKLLCPGALVQISQGEEIWTGTVVSYDEQKENGSVSLILAGTETKMNIGRIRAPETIIRLLSPEDTATRLHFASSQAKYYARVLQVFYNGTSRPKLIEIKMEDKRTVCHWKLILKNQDLLMDWIFILTAKRLNNIWAKSKASQFVWHGADGKRQPVNVPLYSIYLMGRVGGLIEFVSQSRPTSRLWHWVSYLTYPMGLLNKFYSPSSNSFKSSNKLLMSSVGSFVAAYLLQVNDMHQDNVLYNGELLLIDFGFLAGDQPFPPTNPFPLPYALKFCFKSEPNMWEDFKELSWEAIQDLKKEGSVDLASAIDDVTVDGYKNLRYGLKRGLAERTNVSREELDYLIEWGSFNALPKHVSHLISSNWNLILRTLYWFFSLLTKVLDRIPLFFIALAGSIVSMHHALPLITHFLPTSDFGMRVVVESSQVLFHSLLNESFWPILKDYTWPILASALICFHVALCAWQNFWICKIRKGSKLALLGIVVGLALSLLSFLPFWITPSMDSISLGLIRILSLVAGFFASWGTKGFVVPITPSIPLPPNNQPANQSECDAVNEDANRPDVNQAPADQGPENQVDQDPENQTPKPIL